MTRSSRPLSLVLAFGILLAVSAPILAGDMGKTHEVAGEVVSANFEAKTITIKDDKGESKTATVLPAAADALKGVRAGDRVILTCQDTDKGDHVGVSGIKVTAVAKN
jgi:hypothetical protein